ncbi:unnamed protein product [Phytophthora fragariaefolia]|uniref:Unnamed protein product n=1 Tax=Phytophthora fragariaefolia TaxID=1490495 RepID=A0A9W6YPZ5_9STRA|nr:unnamed protein product [Phytophthora fragariaefolia]
MSSRSTTRSIAPGFVESDFALKANLDDGLFEGGEDGNMQHGAHSGTGHDEPVGTDASVAGNTLGPTGSSAPPSRGEFQDLLVAPCAISVSEFQDDVPRLSVLEEPQPGDLGLQRTSERTCQRSQKSLGLESCSGFTLGDAHRWRVASSMMTSSYQPLIAEASRSHLLTTRNFAGPDGSTAEPTLRCAVGLLVARKFSPSLGAFSDRSMLAYVNIESESNVL